MWLKKLNAVVALAMIGILPMTQVHAGTVTLDQAISDLNYSLTVEWDQKDSAVYKAATEKFLSQIAALKAQGMSMDQIVTQVKAKVLDKQSAADVDQIVAIAKINKLSDKEIHDLVVKQISQNRAQGATWSDNATKALVITLVAALLVVAVLAGADLFVVVSGSNSCYNESCYYNTWGDYVCTCYD